MVKIITHENVDEMETKIPMICFHAQEGACGASGLMFAVFNDKSVYAYSNWYENHDVSLIHKIESNVPEFVVLTCGKYPNFNPKRQRYSNEMKLYNLGLGNAAYVNKKIVRNDLTCRIQLFCKLVEEYCGETVLRIFEKVRDYFRNSEI